MGSVLDTEDGNASDDDNNQGMGNNRNAVRHTARMIETKVDRALAQARQPSLRATEARLGGKL